MKRRVPVVRQMNSFECGAACLAMVLGYFGRKTRLEECRARCHPGRDGVTAKTIVEAARQFGLEAQAFAMTAEGPFFGRAAMHPLLESRPLCCPGALDEELRRYR